MFPTPVLLTSNPFSILDPLLFFKAEMIKSHYLTPLIRVSLFHQGIEGLS